VLSQLVKITLKKNNASILSKEMACNCSW